MSVLLNILVNNRAESLIGQGRRGNARFVASISGLIFSQMHFRVQTNGDKYI